FAAALDLGAVAVLAFAGAFDWGFAASGFAASPLAGAFAGSALARPLGFAPVGFAPAAVGLGAGGTAVGAGAGTAGPAAATTADLGLRPRFLGPMPSEAVAGWASFFTARPRRTGAVGGGGSGGLSGS